MNWQIIAERLKELRKDNNLSHDKLAKIITEKYTSIGAASLKKYEVADEFHTDKEKVKGMKIEYLYSLADFYGVSADYILGRTKHKFTDVSLQQIPEKLGLTEKAVDELTELKKDNDLEWINIFLENHLIDKIGLALEMYHKLYMNNECYRISNFLELNDIDKNNLNNDIKLQALNSEQPRYEYYELDKCFSDDSEVFEQNISVPIPIAKQLYADLIKEKLMELIDTYLKEEFEKKKRSILK